jgi:glycosyltransferase involved in cell wall biosynthesis
MSRPEAPGGTISVVMPVYNAARFVRRAAESALAQDEVGELLLVEDGSTDGSRAECESLAAADARVRLMTHPDGANHGAAASRNLGWRAARCPLIAFLDADDYYLPQRFAVTVLQFADQHVDGVYEATGVAYESDAARAQFESVRGKDLAERGLTTLAPGIAPRELCAKLLWSKLGYCHLDGLTVRRALMDRSGGFLDALRLHQDSHLLIRLAWHGNLVAGTIDRAVAVRYLHANNRISRATRDVSLPYRRVFWRALVDWALSEGLPGELLRFMMLRLYHDEFGDRHLPRWRRRGRFGALLLREWFINPLRVSRAVLRVALKRRGPQA